MPSLILDCSNCNQRFEYRYDDDDIAASIVCPLCGKERSCDDYSALLFCPKCYSKLEVPLNYRHEKLQCPRCSTIVPFGTSFSFDELAEQSDEPVKHSRQNRQWTLSNEELFDKYRIIRPLGAGGMAEVYLAEHILLHQNCALKILKTSVCQDKAVFVRRFLLEAKIAYSISHPNIVRVFDVGNDAETGLLFLAMEYVDGCTLTKIINDTQTPLPETTLLYVAQQIALALTALAENKVVHRDIKPSNIMRNSKGDIKLADLGIARLETADTALTMTQAAIGTPAYASPEQCTDAHRTDARSDIYSLGATLYHLATGKPPFSGANPMEIMLNVIKKRPEPLAKLRPDISPRTIAIIEAMMDKSPEKRPQTATALLAMIDGTEKVRTVRNMLASKTAGQHPVSWAALEMAKLREADNRNHTPTPLTPYIPPRKNSRIWLAALLVAILLIGLLCILKLNRQNAVNPVKTQAQRNARKPTAPQQQTDRQQTRDWPSRLDFFVNIARQAQLDLKPTPAIPHEGRTLIYRLQEAQWELEALHAIEQKKIHLPMLDKRKEMTAQRIFLLDNARLNRARRVAKAKKIPQNTASTDAIANFLKLSWNADDADTYREQLIQLQKNILDAIDAGKLDVNARIPMEDATPQTLWNLAFDGLYLPRSTRTHNLDFQKELFKRGAVIAPPCPAINHGDVNYSLKSQNFVEELMDYMPLGMDNVDTLNGRPLPLFLLPISGQLPRLGAAPRPIAQNANWQLVSLCIDLGTEFRLTDEYGNTALHYAAQFNQPDLAEKLLIYDFGLAIIKNDEGMTPIQIARQENAEAVLKVFMTFRQ